MAFRTRMHDRNIYKIRPDFKMLAATFPDFGKHVYIDGRGKSCIDFKDIKSLRALTQALLQKDFNLNVEIPEGFLVPTIPQRLNYILWVEDLLAELSPINNSVHGVDIGTGPCCIFALLGTRKNDWSFLATESSDESITWALQNVEKNNLKDKIEVLKVSKDSALKDVVESRNKVYDFCFCNPPFFENMDDVLRGGYKYKTPDDVNAKTDEIIADGGEVSFVTKIIADSLVLREKVRLYTSMLGKKRSLKEIKDVLRNIKDVTFTSVEFYQGNTARWGVAWTFLKTSFKKQEKKKVVKKPLPPLSFVVPKKEGGSVNTVGEVLEKLKLILTECKIDYKISSHMEDWAEMTVQATENTWSNQRRKKRKQMFEAEKNGSSQSTDETLDTKPGQDLPLNPGMSGLKRPLECDETAESPSKMPKKDQDSDEKDEEPCTSLEGDQLLLYCSIKLVKAQGSVLVEMNCPGGSNRDSMHQICQLFKNRL